MPDMTVPARRASRPATVVPAHAQPRAGENCIKLVAYCHAGGKHDMPTYDYRCEQCGDFARMRPISQRDTPYPCPGCGAPAARALVAAPSLAGTTAGSLDRNDGGASHMHSATCGCGSGGVRLAGRAG